MRFWFPFVSFHTVSWVSGSSTGGSVAGVPKAQGMRLTPSVLPVRRDIKGVPMCSKKGRGWEKCNTRLGGWVVGCEEAPTSNCENEECFMDGEQKAPRELSLVKLLILRGDEGSYKFAFLHHQPTSLSPSPIFYKEILVFVLFYK